MVGLGIQLITSLAVVVGLLLLIAKLTARRFGGRPGSAVRVIARQSISRGSGVVVVSVGSRVLVLGATEQQVSLLTEVDPLELELDLAPTDLDLDPADLLGPEGDELPVDPARSNQPGRPAPVQTGRVGGRAEGAFAGSLISPQTWRQAMAAVTGQRTGAPDRERIDS